MISLVPLLLLALSVTTVLAFTQHPRPRALTTASRRGLQLFTWLTLFLFGAFCPDFGDAPDSEISLLTQVFGWSQDLLDLSYSLMVGLGAAATVAYLVLLGLLVFARPPPLPSPEPASSGTMVGCPTRKPPQKKRPRHPVDGPGQPAPGGGTADRLGPDAPRAGAEVGAVGAGVRDDHPPVRRPGRRGDLPPPTVRTPGSA